MAFCATWAAAIASSSCLFLYPLLTRALFSASFKSSFGRKTRAPVLAAMASINFGFVFLSVPTATTLPYWYTRCSTFLKSNSFLLSTRRHFPEIEKIARPAVVPGSMPRISSSFFLSKLILYPLQKPSALSLH